MIWFFVKGLPSPGGSKRYVGLAKSTGRAILIDAGGKRTKDWRQAVAEVARIAHRTAPLDCPIRLRVVFHMKRPKAHFNKHGLREDAPTWHTNAPDTTKLLRSTEDALTGIVWTDDCRVVEQTAQKRYCEAETYDAQVVGAYVTIEGLI